MAAKTLLRGIPTKFYFTILSASHITALAADPTAVPTTNVSITTSAAITNVSTSVAVSALSGSIPQGTPITLTASGASLTVYTTADAITGATSIAILAPGGSNSLASLATGTYTPKLQLRGGTASQFSLNNASQVVRTYFDPGETLSFDDVVITSASWQMTYSSAYIAGDNSGYRLRYAANNALAGIVGYLWRELESPVGYTIGESVAGQVVVEQTTQDAPVDNVLSTQYTIKGKGSPLILPAVK
jgi:hypothetical protein